MTINSPSWKTEQKLPQYGKPWRRNAPIPPKTPHHQTP
jgi:hypothetical protein